MHIDINNWFPDFLGHFQKSFQFSLCCSVVIQAQHRKVYGLNGNDITNIYQWGSVSLKKNKKLKAHLSLLILSAVILIFSHLDLIYMVQLRSHSLPPTEGTDAVHIFSASHVSSSCVNYPQRVHVMLDHQTLRHFSTTRNNKAASQLMLNIHKQQSPYCRNH